MAEQTPEEGPFIEEMRGISAALQDTLDTWIIAHPETQPITLASGTAEFAARVIASVLREEVPPERRDEWIAHWTALVRDTAQVYIAG